MEPLFKRNLLLFLISGLVLISDQLSKILIRLSGGFYICNPFIALGLKIPAILFWFFWIGIIFLISYLFYKKRNATEALYLIIIFAGAFSNLLDRFWHGCIIDFINLGWGPIFNLADLFITLGAIMLIVTQLKVKR